MLLHDVDDPPIWCDVGVSGSVPLTRRGAGRAMLSEIEPGDTIVSAKLDRLFRSASDALTQAEELHRRGIDIVLLDTGTEPVMSSASGKLFFSMLAAFAEFERARIRERISDGKRGKMARGGHAGGEPPYGFFDRSIGPRSDAGRERPRKESDGRSPTLARIGYFTLEGRPDVD